MRQNVVPENFSVHPRQELHASIYYSLEMRRLLISQTYTLEPLKMLCNTNKSNFLFIYLVITTLTQKIKNSIFIKLHFVYHLRVEIASRKVITLSLHSWSR